MSISTRTAALVAPRKRHRLPARRRQRGVVLFITLIALLILMISGIALVRSFDASLTHSGNIALKRDLINQAERGINAAVAKLNSGALSADAARQTTSAANNYSATTLPSDSHGIPTMLTGASSWSMSQDNDIVDATSHATIRYVIDRMCNASGVETTTNCVYSTPKVSGGDNREQRAAPANLQIVYRISVRVTSENQTQTFVQTTGYM
ncbi:MAG TPA: hypothetical protein VF472_04255 [Burkholderiaceae bacterium]